MVIREYFNMLPRHSVAGICNIDVAVKILVDCLASQSQYSEKSLILERFQGEQGKAAGYRKRVEITIGWN